MIECEKERHGWVTFIHFILWHFDRKPQRLDYVRFNENAWRKIICLKRNANDICGILRFYLFGEWRRWGTVGGCIQSEHHLTSMDFSFRFHMTLLLGKSIWCGIYETFCERDERFGLHTKYSGKLLLPQCNFVNYFDNNYCHCIFSCYVLLSQGRTTSLPFIYSKLERVLNDVILGALSQ